MQLPGLNLDLGDVVLTFTARVKGRQRFGMRLHLGVPQPTVPDDRVPRPGTPISPLPQGVTSMVDLAADHMFPILTPDFTDEVGNPVPTPAGAVFAYSVSDPTVLVLTDNGDGTGAVAATGVLGSSNLHIDAVVNGDTLTGDETVNVVAGVAERIAINLGAAEETTPDV